MGQIFYCTYEIPNYQLEHMLPIGKSGIDPKPAKYVVTATESKLIKSLLPATDLYIWHTSGQSNENGVSLKIGAKYLDPYNNLKSVSSLEFWATAPTHELAEYNLIRDINSLPEYDHLLYSVYTPDNINGYYHYPLYNPWLMQYRNAQMRFIGLGDPIDRRACAEIPAIGALTTRFSHKKSR